MPAPDEHSPRMVGRYVLYGELASGGMATVHFGRLSGAIGFSRTVAIKRLHPQFAKDPEFVTMFLDEARLCGRIRHPSVVPTLDVVASEGEICIVMEYVAGEALSKLLKLAAQRRVPPTPRVVASILSSVLHGLHAAHQTKDEHGRDLGIVHRDVSPQNILVGADGTARVLDFGVAKAAGRLQTTRDGQVKGKIAYMPPEQLNGHPVTKQVDVYAASVVLWEALTGRRLFDGETEAIVLARALDGKVPLPSQLNPALGGEIDALVLRGLARDPAQRFASAREMALAIEQTMGLASMSEVAAWVEVAGDEELRRRAQTVAEIELASARAPVNPISLPPAAASSRRAVQPLDVNEHSQVSSISVSSPSVPVPPPRGRSAAKWVVSAVGVAVLSGAAMTVLAVRLPSFDRASTSSAAPSELVVEKRSLAVLGPEAVPARAPKEPERPPAARIAPARPRPCDPPYVIDPTTGNKKYKRECLP